MASVIWLCGVEFDLSRIQSSQYELSRSLRQVVDRSLITHATPYDFNPLLILLVTSALQGFRNCQKVYDMTIALSDSSIHAFVFLTGILV
jgi:hypothetical protein